jgi:hypothetical protein
MKNSLRVFLLSFWAALLQSSCLQQSGIQQSVDEESTDAKALLQGIWKEVDTEEVIFRVKGDTLYYADSVSQPSYFYIIKDTFFLGHNKYAILKQSANIFYFCNQNNDVVKLHKSDDPNDVLSFSQNRPIILTSLSEVVKCDSVVSFNGQRYHWYIAVNPTKYRVVRTSYNDDGISVENIYYDNIIHVGLYKGSERLYSSDFRKSMFVDIVPHDFLEQAILGNMKFARVDASGFYFDAILSIPDGVSCYQVSVIIDFSGELTMRVVE